MKKCSKCGVEKPLDQFHKQTSNGRPRGSCKPCVNKANADRNRAAYKGGIGYNQGRVPLPPAERLNELFVMDGKRLVRRTSRGNSKAGQIVGKLRDDGYRRVWVDGVHALIHRVVWKMHTGEEPPKYVDHINGERDDNRFDNLRAASHSENMWNMCNASMPSNGFVGVRWHEYYGQKGVWAASIGAKKSINCGRFDRIEDALAAYEKAVIQHHGDYGASKIAHNRKMADAMGIKF